MKPGFDVSDQPVEWIRPNPTELHASDCRVFIRAMYIIKHPSFTYRIVWDIGLGPSAYIPLQEAYIMLLTRDWRQKAARILTNPRLIASYFIPWPFARSNAGYFDARQRRFMACFHLERFFLYNLSPGSANRTKRFSKMSGNLVLRMRTPFSL